MEKKKLGISVGDTNTFISTKGNCIYYIFDIWNRFNHYDRRINYKRYGIRLWKEIS